MEKLDKLTSPDIVTENIEKLKELFPTAFSEGKVLMNELQALLGDYVEDEKEYYQMTWAGKTEAQREANKVSTGTLRPCPEESKDWETTGNIFIEGDNLEVLKLLQKTYNNKIKMIYIDPPYNTGKEFVYKDNYKDNLQNYLKLTGQADEEGKKFSTNTESDGRYHSNWLNMMYPRLKLARNLLTDDGVIFISIDDNEQVNLKKLCDEIFGEENFESNIIPIANPGGRDYREVAIMNEYLLVYSKTGQIKFNELDKDITFKFKDSQGGFEYRELRNRNPKFHSGNRPNLFYPFYVNPNISENDYCSVSLKKSKDYFIEVYPYNSQGKESVWRWGRNKASKNLVIDDLDMSQITAKQKRDGNWNVYEKNRRSTTKVKSLWDETEMRTENGTREFRKLFEVSYFDHPKPISLIKRAVFLNSQANEIILDFFSGSSTTAHAVMALNAEDGGNRRCISVQLPEPTDEKSEAYKAGYKTIAEIGKERIRRAGKLVKKENADKEGIENLDVGFRVFKLDTTNIIPWDTATDKLEEQLDIFSEDNADHIKQGRSNEDILYEILLKYGLDLTVPIEEKEMDGNRIYNIGFGSMYVCLDEKINVQTAKNIGEWSKDFEDDEPIVVFRDSGFKNDSTKTNTVQTLKQFGIENVKSI